MIDIPEHADLSGAALMLLKFVSIALTGVFGVLGLMTNYKIDGRVTAWGRVALMGIVTSAVVAAATQALEGYRAQQRARAENLAVRAQLHEIARTLDPFETISIDYEFAVPNDDPAWAPYRRRVRQMAERFVSAGESGGYAIEFGFSSSFSGPEGLETLMIKSDAAAYPRRNGEEAVPYWVLQSVDELELAASRNEQLEDIFASGDLTAFFMLSEADVELVYDVRDHSFRIRSDQDQSPASLESRGIRSNLDLSGARVGLRSSGWTYDPRSSDLERAAISDGMSRLRLTNLVVELSHGRRINLTSEQLARRENRGQAVYEGVVTADLFAQ